MTIRYIKPGIIKFCLLGLLTGCASAPDIDNDKYAGAGLNDKSLDLLFATEFPAESEADALARAAQALQAGDVDKALFFYVRALQFHPENVELLTHIGEIQMQRNNFAMAKRAFLMARNYDPTHARSLEGLGLIYMIEGMHEKAINELKSAVANDDQLWRAQNALGVYADKPTILRPRRSTMTSPYRSTPTPHMCLTIVAIQSSWLVMLKALRSISTKQPTIGGFCSRGPTWAGFMPNRAGMTMPS